MYYMKYTRISMYIPQVFARKRSRKCYSNTLISGWFKGIGVLCLFENIFLNTSVLLSPKYRTHCVWTALEVCEGVSRLGHGDTSLAPFCDLWVTHFGHHLPAYEDTQAVPGVGGVHMVKKTSCQHTFHFLFRCVNASPWQKILPPDSSLELASWLTLGDHRPRTTWLGHSDS